MGRTPAIGLLLATGFIIALAGLALLGRDASGRSSQTSMLQPAGGWRLFNCIAAPISREQRTARLDAVVKLRNRGLTHRAIGDALGLARRRVAYILRAAGKSRQAMEFS